MLTPNRAFAAALVIAGLALAAAAQPQPADRAKKLD